MARIKKYNKKDQGEGQTIKKSTRATQRSKDRLKDAPMKSAIQLQQLDGKLYNKHNVRSIDELLGETTNKYKTHDVKEYEAQLNRMNTSDLQTHAVTVQVMPKENRTLLIKLLVKQFQINNSTGANVAQPVTPSGKPITQETLDILAEGR